MKLSGIIALVALVLQGSSSPLLDRNAQTLSYESKASRRTIPESYVQHEEQTEGLTRRWFKDEIPRPDTILPMRIGLKQQNLDKGHEILMKISDPKSKDYGKHLSATEVIDLFAPSDETFESVREWLIDAGIAASRLSQSANKQWLQFDAKVSEVEQLLMTKYMIYRHSESGTTNIACEKYHVPKEIQDHIDYITPGIKLMGLGDAQELRKKKNKRSTGPDGTGPERFELPVESLGRVRAAAIANRPYVLNGGCDMYMTPDCIRALYQIPQATKKMPGNEMGIFQSLGQHYTQTDLDIFFYGFTKDIPNGTHPELRSINGAIGPTDDIWGAGTEANLDFQIAYGLIWPQETVLYQVDDEVYQYNQTFASSPFKGFFNNLWNAIDGSYCTSSAYGESGNCKRPACLDPFYPNPNPDGYQGELMCGAYNRTNVISISYSGGETDYPYSYQQRQCAEIMKLGLQGTTVVISSGDDGVASLRGDPSPSGCVGPSEDVFHPQFLSTCPYILSVGSTYLPMDSKPEAANEVATTRFPSGGGFSNIFGTPQWQVQHIANYFKNVKLPFIGYAGGGLNFSNANQGQLGQFNILGRAYPDVSANGDNVVISSRGIIVRVGGTSASAPLFGSILNLINEERLAVGKKPVGFVHQVLYNHPEVFTDITVGSNPGCGTTGFLASTGWDPVTGLGTPNYPKMLDLFMSLP